MLSRVAHAVYWMSRYIERAENVARMVGVNLHLLLDLPGPGQAQWLPTVQVTGNDKAFTEQYPEATRDAVLEFLTFDQDNPDSIESCIRLARENARAVREIISSEMWEEINRLYLSLQGPDAREHALADPYAFFQEIKRASHLIEGTKNETMPHDEAWHFSTLGRLLERADQTTRILDVKYFFLLPSPGEVGRPVDDLQWSAVLRSISAFEAYRKRHGQIAVVHIVDFLLLDRVFPRAVHHCTGSAQESLHAISGTPMRRFGNTAERSLGRLVADLDYTDANEIIEQGLHQYLDSLQLRLIHVGADLWETFFAVHDHSQRGRTP